MSHRSPSRRRREGRQAAFLHYPTTVDPDTLNPYKAKVSTNPRHKLMAAVTNPMQWLDDIHARDWREGWDAKVHQLNIERLMDYSENYDLEEKCWRYHAKRREQGYATMDWDDLEERNREEYREAMRAALS